MKVCIVTLLVYLAWTQGTQSHTDIIGYDCRDPDQLETISTISSQSCILTNQDYSTEKRIIQLVQIKKQDTIKLLSCFVTLEYKIFRCGVLIDEAVKNPTSKRFVQMDSINCLKLHSNQKFELDGNIIDLQGSTTYNTYLTGNVDKDGKCSHGDPITIEGIYYDRPVVESIYEFKTGILEAVLDYTTNTLTTMDGTFCNYNKGSCFSSTHGNLYWGESLRHESCDNDLFSVLYEGLITKIITRDQEIFEVEDKEVQFSLASTSNTSICGHPALITEHPELMIMEQTIGHIFPFKSRARKNYKIDIDIFKHISVKFLYVQRKISQNFAELEQDIIKHRCELKSQIIRNTLSIGQISAEEFAWQFHGPGTYGLKRGEVIYISKCTPVIVNLRHTLECFDELPVTDKLNRTLFMSPKYHILTKTGTKIPCNNLLKPIFQINNHWIGILQGPHLAIQPKILNPNDDSKWISKSLGNPLLGLYGKQDQDNFTKSLLYPIKLRQVNNDLVNDIMHDEKYMISKSIEEKEWEFISNKLSGKFWSFYYSWGSLWSFVFGWFFLLYMLHFVITKVLNAKKIHREYGWSPKMFNCFYDPLTTQILYRAREPTPTLTV